LLSAVLETVTSTRRLELYVAILAQKADVTKAGQKDDVHLNFLINIKKLMNQIFEAFTV